MSLPLCPKHKVPLLPEGPYILRCPEYGCVATTRAALGEAGKQAKGRSSNLGAFPSGPKVKVLEKDLQIEVVSMLGARGYEVMETGKPRGGQMCNKCGNVLPHPGWQGNTPGLPDLFIRGKGWKRGEWLAVELKGTETPIRDAQQTLCDRGGSYICRSWEEVWAAVQEIEGERETR